MESKIKDIKKKFFEEIKTLKSSNEVENLKIKYLGKKGILQSLILDLKNVEKNKKPKIGKLINDLKQEITKNFIDLLKLLRSKEEKEKLEKEEIDIFLPGKKCFLGNLHPITKLMNKMVDIFINMGFSVQTGPDLESDYYNFEALNFEKNHPARDMQDTFYVSKDSLLRTHTSNTQVRVMEKNSPPIRVIVPGRCFRNENVSSRSNVFFHQIELFYIDEKVSFQDLLVTMDEFWKTLFEKDIKTRYRPSYFPFVEPGMEGDIECFICSGKGCMVCKYSGWLEIFGAGMVHPNVLKYSGIDSEKYFGYAAGLGIERLAMLYYGIDDIRIFTENNLGFLQQF